MALKNCACCGQPFQLRPQVPHQAYCSEKACQRERRKHWQREKLKNDPLYRENARDAQRAWLSKNPDYWRNYRQAHPQSVAQNRNRQPSEKTNLQQQKTAKINASILPPILSAGIYQIRRIAKNGATLSDVWTVKIIPIELDC